LAGKEGSLIPCLFGDIRASRGFMVYDTGVLPPLRGRSVVEKNPLMTGGKMRLAEKRGTEACH